MTSHMILSELGSIVLLSENRSSCYHAFMTLPTTPTKLSPRNLLFQPPGKPKYLETLTSRLDLL
jgi:hypothetical protein